MFEIEIKENKKCEKCSRTVFAPDYRCIVCTPFNPYVTDPVREARKGRYFSDAYKIRRQYGEKYYKIWVDYWNKFEAAVKNDTFINYQKDVIEKLKVTTKKRLIRDRL